MADQATAKLIWITEDRPRLKLKASNGDVVLNEEFPSVALPDNLMILDEDRDPITGAVSFVSIQQHCFVQHNRVQYRIVLITPPPHAQQPNGKC